MTSWVFVDVQCEESEMLCSYEMDFGCDSSGISCNKWDINRELSEGMCDYPDAPPDTAPTVLVTEKLGDAGMRGLLDSLMIELC